MVTTEDLGRSPSGRAACDLRNLRNPTRNPIAEADAYRDTPPEDIEDELQLAKGEIAWLREAIRRAAEQVQA